MTFEAQAETSGSTPVSHHSLGDSWVPGPDGIRERSAARVILLDSDNRVLVVRGHDADDPEHSWWFTVGGGIDEGETPLQAALRETREETGIVLASSDLVGPVVTRTGIFNFVAETCRQYEVFYLARVSNTVEVSTRSWTDAERDLLDDMVWLTPAQLRALPEGVFPTQLPDLVEDLVEGWNGHVRHLGQELDE